MESHNNSTIYMMSQMPTRNNTEPSPISIKQEKQDNGKYKLEFTFQSSDAKEVELSCSDLREWILDTDTDQPRKFNKKNGTDIFSLEINDLPENTNFTYSIIVTNSDNNKNIIYGPNNSQLYKYDTKRKITNNENSSYYEITEKSEIKLSELNELKLSEQTKISIESERFPDSKKQDAMHSFPKRDVWIYKPEGFDKADSKNKNVLFILDGQSFCESLTPYIDAMSQDAKFKDVFANTAIVFVNPGEYTKTPFDRVIEYYFKEEGNDLYLMPALPDNISDNKYKNAYIFIKETSKLFYIHNGSAEEVNINDKEKFNKSLTEIMGNDSFKHLYDKDVNFLITSNGGHNQKENEKNDKFSAFLANQIIPTYCEKLGIENKDNVFLAGHSLAAYPVINVAANHPDQVGGILLFSAALNQNYKTDLLAEKSPKGTRLEKIPIYMQIGQLENQKPTEFAKKVKDMEDKSRLTANQELHARLSKNGYLVNKDQEKGIVTFPSGHSEHNVINGIVDGLRFVKNPEQNKELKQIVEEVKSPTSSENIIKHNH